MSTYRLSTGTVDNLQELVGIKGYDSNEAYSLNEVVLTVVSDSVLLYRSLENNNTSPLTDGTKWKEVSLGGGGGGGEYFGKSMYSDIAPNNASWLASNGQWNARSVYPDYYDWLVRQMNAGVSGFVASTATYTDYDFVINTADQTFRLPLLNGEEDLPSDKFENITFLAAGSNYPVTKNGYFVLDIPVTGVGGQIWGGTSSWFDGRGKGAGCIQWTSPLCKRGQDMVLYYADVGTPIRFTFTVSKGNGSLYYYVGDTVQDASLINAGAVLSDLATKTNSVQAAAASMPSGRYIDLTLGASGSTYTAPANGWLVLNKIAQGEGQEIRLTNTSNSLRGYAISPNGNDIALDTMIPCLKGNVIEIYYSASGNVEDFKFIYSEGEN